MRNNSSSQVSSTSYRRFLTLHMVAGINNEVFFLFLIMMVLFFVNLFSLIRNNVINTIYNVLKRTFLRLINCNLSFIKDIDMNVGRLDKDQKSLEKCREKQYNNQQMCYICLNPIELEVMTGCFHSFCGECIIMYWHSKNKFQINCPVCRRAIKMMYFNESCLKPEVESSEENKKFGQTIKALYEYNYHFSQERREWKEILLEFPFLLKRTLVFLMSREGMQFLLKTVESNFYLLILILYVLSPFDIIPECIFGFIGLIDDLIILILIFIILTNYYYQYISARDSKRYRSFLDF